MATDVDRQSYHGWTHEELSDRDGSQEVSVSKMLDHGSISFGRFAFESLEWEKRSVFTHNKCQEELEKFKSPGLVAQKKAYFEEYYKRVRALKSMQENQQTELALDYGGDGSISSHSGEDDETAAQIKSLGDGSSDVIDADSKEALVGVTSEKKHKSEAIQIRHIDLEPTSSNLKSSRKAAIDINQGKNNKCTLKIQHLDSGSTVHESSFIRTEEFEHHDHSEFKTKEISRKYDKSGSTIMQEKKSSGYDIHINHLNGESTDHELSTRRNEQHQLSSLYVKEISRKCDNLDSKDKSVVTVGGSVFYPANTNAVKPDCNIVSDKSKPTVKKKYKEDHMPVLKLTGPSVSDRNGLKPKSKTLSDIKSSQPQGPKCAFKTTSCKTKNTADSSNTTSDTVPRTYKSTPASSHKPLTEVRSNITIPRPFSFVTERRAVTPAGIRDIELRLHSKTPNRLARSLIQAKDVINVQDASRKTARAYGVKNKGTENKRGSEEVKKIDLFNSHKGRGADVPGLPKARVSRSVNLPAWNHSNSHGGSENRSTNAVRKSKQEQVKDLRFREVRIVSTTIATPRKIHHIHTRQELPRWR